MSSWVTTLIESPGNIAFFCESFSDEKRTPKGEVGVKGPDALDDLEVSDVLTGKGIDDGLLYWRGGSVVDGVGDRDSEMFEEDRELRGGKETKLGGVVERCEYGIGGAAG